MKNLKAALIMMSTVALLGAAPVMAEEEAQEITTISAVDAINIAETREDGSYVAGVRIEYTDAINVGTVDYTSYQVKGYDVVGTYVNDTGEWGDTALSGKYVFLVVDAPSDTNPVLYKTHTNYGGYDEYTPPVLTVAQLSNITVDEEGNVAEEGSTVISAFGLQTQEQVNLLADDFLAGEYVVDGTDYNIMYRLFVPEGYEEGGTDAEALPLVIYYHGGGEGGYDNITPLLTSRSAVQFASEEWQSEHPCFVLVPQNPTKSGGDPEFMEAALGLINQVLEEYNVDEKRIYTMGTSAGTKSVIATDIAMPDKIAGSLLASTAMFEYTEEEHETIKDIPTWLITAADEIERRLSASEAFVATAAAIGREAAANIGEESWNGYLADYEAEQQAMEQIALAEEMGTNLMYTHYQVNTVEPEFHLNYLHAFTNNAVLEWLFAQSK